MVNELRVKGDRLWSRLMQMASSRSQSTIALSIGLARNIRSTSKTGRSAEIVTRSPGSSPMLLAGGRDASMRAVLRRRLTNRQSSLLALGLMPKSSLVTQ